MQSSKDFRKAVLQALKPTEGLTYYVRQNSCREVEVSGKRLAGANSTLSDFDLV